MAKTGDRTAAFEARRMEILHKVALAFAEEGYHQTSVSSLADRLGVSKPVLYYYAKNKDDLLFQCVLVGRNALQQAMEKTKKINVTGAGKLRHFFSTYTEIMCGDFGRCIALVDPQALNPEARKNDTLARRAIEDAVCQMVMDGQEDGSIGRCNPIIATRAMFGAFNGIPRWFRTGGEFNARDVAEAYLDLLMHGLTPTGTAFGKAVKARPKKKDD
ncbi:TetR/AcrR family transcriptional regulator [Sphingobium boeckii]|uniref:AcrR family transcriptional regulator n=1 Tax=Sphingobium boeckii TaxID=1082345 RepID=A0A7W9EF37_9SPHN|nr:TetR/AcrR family transcriptional regulator [Sphingobium boeckii]MBB5685670.1 AcrR family transcriptional regulator [Sphingobium boeckii]